MIELRSVRKSYRGRAQPVLEGVELSLGEGEVAVLAGDAGSGKSTLLRLLIGAELADAGTVKVFDRDVARLRRSSIALLRRRVSLVPQELCLLEDCSALDNVRAALDVAGVPRLEANRRAAEALAELGLEGELETPAARLSSSARRAVSLARGLVAAPRLLLLDDPTAHLDHAGVERLLALLVGLPERGITALVAGADPRLGQAALLCGWRQLELRDGRLLDPLAPAGADEGEDLDDPADTDRYEAERPDTGDDYEIEVEIVAEHIESEESADSAMDVIFDDSLPNVVPFPRSARAGGSE